MTQYDGIIILSLLLKGEWPSVHAVCGNDPYELLKGNAIIGGQWQLFIYGI